MSKKDKKSLVEQEIDVINSQNVPALHREEAHSTIEKRQLIEHLNPKETISLSSTKFLGNSTNLILKLENDFGVSSKDGMYNLVEETNAFLQIDKLIAISTEDDSLALLKDVVTYIETLEFKRIFPHMLDWLKFLLKYDFPNRKNFIQKTLDFTVSTDVKQSEPILEYVLSWITDKDKDMYKYYIRQFAYKSLKTSEFTLAAKYFDKGLEIDNKDNFALWGMIYASVKSTGQALVPFMDNFQDFQPVENMIAACDNPKELKEALEKLILSAIKYVQDTDGLTGKNNVFKAFEKFLSYVPIHMDNYLRTVMIKMADICKAKKIFGPAIKYYSWALTLREETEIYWSLLQAKVMCSNNDELVNQAVTISRLPEYHQALTRADAETKVKYKALDEKQKVNEKAKIKENKQRATLTAVQRITIIVVVVVAVVLGSVLGGVYGYKATTKLKFNANGDLGGYSVYHAKNFSETDVIIPANYSNSEVVSIEDGAFAGDSTIETLTLPLTLKNIGIGAFKNCTNLKTVVFKNYDEDEVAYADGEENTSALVSIQESAFEGCINLTEFVIPDGVVSIGNKAFANTNLEDVNIPGTLTTIGDNVFSGCTNLKTISLVDRDVFPIEWGDIWVSSDSLEQDQVQIKCNIKIYVNPNYVGTAAGTFTVGYKESYYIAPATRVGYKFLGWYDTADCNNVKYTDENGQSLKPWDKDGAVELFAKWEALERTLHFDKNADDAEGTMADIVDLTGSKISLPGVLFTRAGYNFVGWATDSSAKTAKYADLAEYTMGYRVTNTLYAVWEKQ